MPPPSARCSHRADEELVTHVDGLALHMQKLKTPTGTGYRNVYRNGAKFLLRISRRNGDRPTLGVFHTAVEAATRYAQLVAAPDGFEAAVARTMKEDKEAFLEAFKERKVKEIGMHDPKTLT